MSFTSCSSCAQCCDSHPAYCDGFARENYTGRPGSMTAHHSGEKLWSRFFGHSSFAQYSIVSNASVVNAKDLVHDDQELQLFAPLGCGFQTGMGAIQNTASASSADTVMILGLGAVGMGALMVKYTFSESPLCLSVKLTLSIRADREDPKLQRNCCR